ncbi:MAG: iron-containing alcohol dehydrogenase [Oscillospiraceae bacterium]|nr:iron-containing alcohol dehydrogenase [Oscillospiraceae bacterium]
MPKYFMPTTLLSGRNCIKRHSRHLIHGKKCMIITGKHSAVVSGALADVTEILNSNDVEFELYDKITVETGITEIYELGQTMKRNKIDYVIGIGGGSTLDAAKAAAVYAANDIEPMQIYEEVYENRPLKVVCVPTTAGTGSDTTQYVMMTLDDVHNKRSFSSPDCFPYATFLDSRYTMTLPVEVTRNTAIDALCHAVESYLNNQASAFSDIVALEAIRLIGSCAGALASGEFTEEDREKLLVAASLGGMAVAHTGLNVVHAMGHQLTCEKEIPHGRANGVLLVEFIAWMAKHDIMRAVEVVTALGTDLSDLRRFIDKVIPTTEEITEADIDKCIENSITDTVLENCPGEFTKEDERIIYYNALINKDRKYTEW